MGYAIKLKKLPLSEMGEAVTKERRSHITIYTSAIKVSEGEEFYLVRILPPDGREFADLLCATQLSLDIVADSTDLSLPTQRAIKHLLKNAGIPRRLFPNEGLAIEWRTSGIEFMASVKIAKESMQLFKMMIKRMGDKVLANQGDRTSAFPLEGFGGRLWKASADYLEKSRKKSLALTKILYDELELMPLDQRVVPTEMRLKWSSCLSVVKLTKFGKLSRGSIDELAVMRAACINRLSDPCLFAVAETELGVLRTPAGLKTKALANAKIVTLPNGEVLDWEEQLVSYLERMRRDYPWYWTRLASAKNDVWIPLSWEPMKKKK
jgi:hypothetical protein